MEVVNDVVFLRENWGDVEIWCCGGIGGLFVIICRGWFSGFKVIVILNLSGCFVLMVL